MKADLRTRIPSETFIQDTSKSFEPKRKPWVSEKNCHSLRRNLSLSSTELHQTTKTSEQRANLEDRKQIGIAFGAHFVPWIEGKRKYQKLWTEAETLRVFEKNRHSLQGTLSYVIIKQQKLWSKAETLGIFKKIGHSLWRTLAFSVLNYIRSPPLVPGLKVPGCQLYYSRVRFSAISGISPPGG